MKSITLTVELGEGRDRAISHLVRVANNYKSRIVVTYEDRTFNAKSLMGVIALFPEDGTSITVTVDGEDEDIAASGMSAFFSAE